MKIDLSTIDRTQFVVDEHIIADETCHLVTPQRSGCEWTKDNLHLRSSLWNSQGELISASYRKHFNIGEKPDIDPLPADLNEMTLMEKIDGSTLIVSHYKGQVIARTRGTVDASKLLNGDEIAVLKARYPKAFVRLLNVPDVSLIFEWVSPRNVIVVKYPEPDLYMTGAISHLDYGYFTQPMVDWLAANIGVKRPRRFTFGSIDEMMDTVADFQNQEGVCAYFNADNTYRKAKGDWYCRLHSFKEHATLRNTVEIWFAQGRPDQARFEENLVKTFDWECMKMVQDHVKSIAEQATILGTQLGQLTLDVLPLRGKTRKDAALHIIANHPTMQGAAFQLLTKGQVEEKTYRKMLESKLGL